MENKKSIYVLFFSTTTKIGAMIRAVTRYQYNHVAISLDDNLDSIYGFSRYKRNVPLVGGFTRESALRYSDREYVRVKVCKIDVEEKKYNEIKIYINQLAKNPKEYMYNVFSAVAFAVHKKVNIKKSYICLEFIIHILSKFEVVPDIKEEKFYTIKQVDKILENTCIFEGNFNEKVKSTSWGEDLYSEQESLKEATIDTVIQIGKLINRKIKDNRQHKIEEKIRQKGEKK